MDALELINPEVYPLLVHRAAHDRQWAEYLLLINCCLEILKQIPTTPEACNQANIEDLLIETLERVGKAIGEVLPGGAKEFREYMPLP